MTFEERMTKLLVRAWDLWVTPGDGNQERAARLLHTSVTEAASRKWTETSLFVLCFEAGHRGVTKESFGAMIRFVLEWSPPGQRPIDWADTEAELLFEMVRDQKTDEEIVRAIGESLRRAAQRHMTMGGGGES